MPKQKGYMDRCRGCGTNIWIPLNKNKVKVFCRKCENKIRRGESIKSKDNIKLITEKVDIKKEIETLRQIEVNNPVLLEGLRNEKEKKEV